MGGFSRRVGTARQRDVYVPVIHPGGMRVASQIASVSLAVVAGTASCEARLAERCGRGPSASEEGERSSPLYQGSIQD